MRGPDANRVIEEHERQKMKYEYRQRKRDEFDDIMSSIDPFHAVCLYRSMVTSEVRVYPIINYNG